MKGKVIAILEARAGEHLAELVARRGAVAMRAPGSLAAFGVKPSFEASPPKLGPLVAGLEAALGG